MVSDNSSCGNSDCIEVELFGGILVAVAVVTNVVSVVFTYMIMKKKMQDWIINNQSSSNSNDNPDYESTIANAHCSPTENQINTMDNRTNYPDQQSDNSFSLSETGNEINHDAIYDVPHDDEANKQKDFNKKKQPSPLFNELTSKGMIHLPVMPSTVSERRQPYLAPMQPGNVYDSEIIRKDEDEYELCDSTLPRSSKNRKH